MTAASARPHPSSLHRRSAVARAGLGLALLGLLALAGGCGRQDPLIPADASAPSTTAATDIGKAAGRTAVGPVVVTAHPVLAATFTVAWSEPASLPLAPRPLTGYAVALDTTGPVNAATWRRTTQVLEIVPAGQRAYTRTYGPATPGVVAGAQAWLTVVPVYGGDSLGAIGGSVAFHVTAGFVIVGRVISDQGAPLGEVDIHLAATAYGPVARTAADGTFRTAPLIAGQAYALRTEAAADWYDYTTLPLGAGDPAPVICLLDRRPLQFPLDSVDSKLFLGVMTKWFYHNVGATRPFVRWDAFPLRVHIAEGTNTTGNLDLAALAREQIAFLNAAVGRELWVETADSTQAQVRVRIYTIPGFLGRTYLNPDDASAVWGAAPPRWMRLVLDPAVATEQQARFVLNHELGHTLYIGSHSTNANHLMWYQGGVVPGVPSVDDLRLFRAVATIPAGTDYNRYEE